MNRRPSRIGLRLFAFNLLVLFVPVAGILYLDVYEGRLLETQEQGMAQQARVIAAALSAERVSAPVLLEQIEEPLARIRVFDLNGQVVADSARLGGSHAPRPSEAYSVISDPRRRFLYRVGAALVIARDTVASALWRALSRARTRPTADSGAAGMPSEVRLALAGQYGAAARPTPGQRSLTLNSAVPIRRNGTVVGAVVVSQSTYRILQALYDVRLRLFEIVLLSLASAILLTSLVSSTIVRPVLRLRQTAAALASRQTALSGRFAQVNRKDEIGGLARSLEALASRLDAHIRLLESVSADVAHEFKNPLAAIRTAAETIADEEDPAERRRFLEMVVRDIDRLEMLVTGIRDLARIDAELATGERQDVDIVALLKRVVEGHRLIVPVAIRLDAQNAIVVNGSSDRLSQVFENLIANAVSFSPDGEAVDVSAAATEAGCVIYVRDRGPGIPAAHLGRIFARFFSYRPSAGRREHMGLGLAIAKTIVDGYGGSIDARNRPNGGAEFEVRLPSLKTEKPEKRGHST